MQDIVAMNSSFSARAIDGLTHIGGGIRDTDS
jgi:hypothetical protein